MALKLNFREVTPEDTEILRMIALRNGKAEDYLCYDVTNEDGVTQTTWYSKADVALWGEDYIRAHTTMKYSDYSGWIIILDKIDLLTLNRTGLDDAGLLQAASIPRLSHIQIDHTTVTYEGLLAIAGNSRIEPVAHVQFTQEQMEHFSQLQREKAKKPAQLDEQAAAECRRVLSAFFAEMTEWERYMEQAGFEDAQAVPRLLAIWEKYVSEKPRLGYRPLALSYSAQGTYNGEEFLDAEQITKNKLYIYTREKNTGFDRRFLMKRVGDGWKIDAVQERLNGWQRIGL